MEGFRIDLKTFLGLAKPKYQAGFGVIISGQNLQGLRDLLSICGSKLRT